MSGSADRARIEELLQDETLSYREIARQTGASDWTVRRIARDVAGDVRPMKRARHEHAVEPLGLASWAILAGLGGIFVGALWFLGRGMSPPDA